jgi:hypothetical protein
MVMVPTRGRRANCERLIESFRETASPGTDLVFILDVDDQDTYEGVDWGPASAAVLDPRDYLVGKLNKMASAMVDLYPALMWLGDDNVFRTSGWDRLMLDALENLGGSGWVYPDDKRRSDVPEHWLCSSDVVKALGWFANPHMGHFYIDNSIADLGNRSRLIRYCPEAIIAHLHYQVDAETERDRTYQETEATWGQSDLVAFRKWQAEQAAYEVALLRRKFNPDVRWVTGKVA